MNSPPPDENDTLPQAHFADAARGRAFLLRLFVTLVALAIYQVSGLSSHLLDGLGARFDGAWWPVHALYLFVTFFGLGALLLPLSLYEDFIISAQESGEQPDFEEWLLDELKAMAVDLVAAVAFFLALYGILHFLPRLWWLAATVIYSVITFIVSIIPQLQGPPAEETTELRDPQLRDRLAALLQRAGLPTCGLFRWHGDGSLDTPMLGLQGLGRRRRVIVSDAMIRDFSADEIEALLAHEASHPRHADTLRFNLVGTVLSFIAFVATAALARAVARALGAPDVTALAAFPYFSAMLLLTTFAGLPLLNAYSRRREYAADNFAAHHAGGDALRSALEKLNDGDSTASPPGFLDLLLHSQPGFAHRLWRLRGKRKP